MTLVKASAKGLALFLFSVAMLPAVRLHAAEEQPRRVVRLYNAGPAEQEINAHGEVRVLLPGTHTDLEFDDRELGDLSLPATVIAVERLPLDDRETDELHVLNSAAAATCAPTVPVRVPLLACRFGTAEAQVEPIPGATYAWTVEGGTIVSGNGTPAVLLGFGGAFSVAARVTVTQDGCVSAGAAVLNLRDPLQATVSAPDANVGTPVRLTWSYNTAEQILTQVLQLPDVATPIRLPPDARSYVFTPATEGSKTVKLTAALYRIGARRRAASSGTGPQASVCGYVETQNDMRVRPRCTEPTAVVSGGGTSCNAENLRVRFQGTPPFTGRWSDGVPFSTTATELERTVTQSGSYSIAEFSDGVCNGRASGEAQVTIAPRTQLTSFTVNPPSVAVLDGRATISYAFINASSCRFTAAALGNYVSAQPSCSGTGSGSLTYIPENAGGNETMKLEVTGPCGTDEGTLSFLVCDYHAIPVAAGPTTFCQGGAVTLNVEIFAGHTAGPPYREYRIYRCTNTFPGACQYASEYSLVQQSPSPTYVATQSGGYRAATEDRLGCPSVEGGSVRVTVNSCP